MGKRKNRSYSEEFRKEAVNLVLKQGLTQTKVAQDLGVSQSILNLRMLGLSGRWREYWDQAALPHLKPLGLAT